jgi:uncharacterized protein
MSDPHAITSVEALRAHYGAPTTLARDKVLAQLDSHCLRFIAASPYLVLASADENGFVDASPRGDAPGFVTVSDPKTLLIPDRKGNNRVDSLANIVANPSVGILFMVPGINETLRINGDAVITLDPDLCASLAVGGRPPIAVLRITVREAYLQCAKALVRSHLWDPKNHVTRSDWPSLGKILADQISGVDATSAERQIQESLRTKLY